MNLFIPLSVLSVTSVVYFFVFFESLCFFFLWIFVSSVVYILFKNLF